MRQKRTGEVLDIAVSGRAAEISQLMHGRGEAIATALRSAKTELATAAQPPAPADGDIAILTDAEFQAKKADLLSRMWHL